MSFLSQIICDLFCLSEDISTQHEDFSIWNSLKIKYLKKIVFFILMWIIFLFSRMIGDAVDFFSTPDIFFLPIVGLTVMSC